MSSRGNRTGDRPGRGSHHRPATIAASSNIAFGPLTPPKPPKPCGDPLLQGSHEFVRKIVVHRHLLLDPIERQKDVLRLGNYLR
jgi:hypothetical protein